MEGQKDLYIAVADRWIPDHMDWNYEEYAAEFARMFDPDCTGERRINPKFGDDCARNTAIADYVWLPFRFEGEMAYLDWHDEWKIEDYE